MKVTFYFRRQNKLNQSIERVFHIVESGLNAKRIETSCDYARSYGHWLLSIFVNIFRTGIRSRFIKGIHHITGDIHYCAILMPKDRTILTIHDLVVLHNVHVSTLYRKFVSFLWYYLPLKHLKKITCISEATRQDLVLHFPFVADKVEIIPNPVNPSFFMIAPKVNLSSCPTILHIGTRSNKNLLRVIESLEGFNIKLRIIGKLDESMVRHLRQYSINYTSASGLTDEQILDEYRNCDIVSFPSTFEGFGMPIIEAQAASRPIITSNIEPMRSIAGNGAILVDPYSISSIRAGFQTIITNADKRNLLIENGLNNAKRYSVDQISEKYKELYINLSKGINL